MNSLPEDVIQKIWFEVHKLNLKEIHGELDEHLSNLVFDTEALLAYFEKNLFDDGSFNPFILIFNPFEYIKILIGMRNKDLMSTHTLYMRSMTYIENCMLKRIPLPEFEIEDILFNDTESLMEMLRKYEHLMEDARELLYNIEAWRTENVDVR